MDKINVFYVLDSSGSMSAMPSEGMKILRNNMKDLENVEPSKQKVIKIFEFGDIVNSLSFNLKDIDEKFSYSTWNSSMGRTSLYDAITVAVLHGKTEGGLMTIITDGIENQSWTSKSEAVTRLKQFRKHGGKVMLIGPGDEEFLKGSLGGEVDSVHTLRVECIHSDMVDCLSSIDYKNSTQTLLSKISTR
jgi:hypothetical protein